MVDGSAYGLPGIPTVWQFWREQRVAKRGNHLASLQLQSPGVNENPTQVSNRSAGFFPAI